MLSRVIRLQQGASWGLQNLWTICNMEVVNWDSSEDPSISFLAINFFAREEFISFHLSYPLFNSIDLVKSYRCGQVLTLEAISHSWACFELLRKLWSRYWSILSLRSSYKSYPTLRDTENALRIVAASPEVRYTTIFAIHFCLEMYCTYRELQPVPYGGS